MKLANNVVRINGYIGTKRTHVDIELEMKQIRYFADGKEFIKNIPQVIDGDDAASLGFKNGLTAVTSYNSWNWINKKRMTLKIW